MPAPNPLEPAELARRLGADLPGWTVIDGHLSRTYKTGGWRASLMIANAIGHLAELAWHHPDLIVTYPSVTVRLTTHDAGGITDYDFALARRIEALITWSPKADGLPGLPTDPAHKYLAAS